MGRRFEKARGRREAGRFAGIPHAVMESPAYIDLSAQAVRLLLELARSFNGYNNGDLSATWRVLQPRGWRSKDTIQRALKELLDHDLILLARAGGRHKCALFALTWAAIDECGGKLDIQPTRTPPGYWRGWNLENRCPDNRGTPTPTIGSINRTMRKNCPDNRVNQANSSAEIDPTIGHLNKLPRGLALDALIQRYCFFEIALREAA